MDDEVSWWARVVAPTTQRESVVAQGPSGHQGVPLRDGVRNAFGGFGRALRG